MSLKLAVVMDPLPSINFAKDSTLPMLWEAQARDWEITYYQPKDLFVRDGQVWGHGQVLELSQDPEAWYKAQQQEAMLLAAQDIVLMRKDPPFNMEYLYSTYMLELAQREGVLVVNCPRALRSFNEKFSTMRFPQCCPPTLITRDRDQLRAFWQTHGDIVVKPLDGMGGASVFRVCRGDGNFSAILEAVTDGFTRTCMAQGFIPEVTAGDKRILLIDGEPVGYALARIAAQGEYRSNLAVGGKGQVVALSDRDRWLCQQVKNTLRQEGLIFVGLDVIGPYITEINVTSPTCIREIEAVHQLNIARALLDCIEQKYRAR